MSKGGYWKGMTKAERRAEIQRRISMRKGKKNLEVVSASPLSFLDNPESTLDQINERLESENAMITKAEGDIKAAKSRIDALGKLRSIISTVLPTVNLVA